MAEIIFQWTSDPIARNVIEPVVYGARIDHTIKSAKNGISSDGAQRFLFFLDSWRF